MPNSFRICSRALLLAALLSSPLAARPVAAAPGDLDPTFGTGGEVTTDINPSGEDTAFAVTLQADGKIVAGGRVRQGTSFDFAVTRYNPDGSLDPTWGTGGIVTTPIENGTDIIQGMLVQPDGKVVVTGWGFIVAHWHDFATVRYNLDGSLDTTWGAAGTGKVITNIGPGVKSDDAPHGIIQQPDGNIVVAGETLDQPTQRTDFAIVRYTSNGLLDPSFGGTGILVTPIGLGGSARALVRQADGMLVAAGESNASDGFHVTLARYRPDGSLDPTFGGTGIVVTRIPSDQGIALAIAQQSDGKLVVAGEVHYPSGRTMDFVVLRYNPDGTLDSTFNGTGMVITPIASASSARAIVVQGTQLIVGGASTANNSDSFTIARYNGNGTLDTTFGPAGIVTTRIGNMSDANALALQPDGRLVAAGGAFLVSGRIAVARYLTAAASGTTTTTLATTTTTTVTTSTTSTTAVTTTSTTTSTTTTTLGGGQVTIALRSIAADDATVIESTATSGVGGFLSATATNVQVGDHTNNGRVKAIVSFDTSGIPDTATVVAATLRLQRVNVFGTNPFTILGQCQIDVQNGSFSGNEAPELTDFQATATAPAAGTLSNPLSNGAWSTGTLNAAGLAAINKTGVTQMRLAFSVHDNGNGVADRILFGSGEQTDPTLRPELDVTYQP